MKLISRSVLLMFLFDLFILISSTYYLYRFFNLPEKYCYCSVFFVVVVGLITLYLKANYKIREFNITIKNTYLLFEGVVFAHIPLACLLLFVVSGFDLIKYLITNILTIFIALRTYRALFHIYLFKLKREKNILIIGAGQNAKIIAEEIINKRALKMKVVGFVEDTKEVNEIINDDDNKIKIFRQSANLKQIIEENNIDIVIVAIKRRMEEELLTKMIFEIPNNVDVYKMQDFYEYITNKCFVDKLTTNWLFYEYMNKRSIYYDFFKRAFDIIAASIILTVMFPVLAYIAIRVKLTDGGSPIFTQDRVGKGGKIFKIYKLRTMYINEYKPKNCDDIKYAESVKGDDRIIPFCRFIRKARFDEIPQMINIIKGEMSIVGPRAEWDKEVQIFSKEISYYPCRMWVRTGWTGWSHINMNPVFSIDEEKERLAYDLYYIKHRNVLWEICILIKAVFLALGGRHK